MAKNRKRRLQDDDVRNEGFVKRLKPSISDTPMPEGVHHYQHFSEVPKEVQKYWRQGYDIFSRYDEGIWMTPDAWFGVTHENVANKIAKHVSHALPPTRKILLDAFCGVGGNTIAFALSNKFSRIYAIEKDPATLACAKHNAEIYGVDTQITWFEGDCFELLGLTEDKSKMVADLRLLVEKFGVIFASPPWGGPKYKHEEVFDLDRMEPYSLQHIHDKFKQVTKNMALYLPRTSDLNQLARYVGERDGKAQVVHYCTNGMSRAMCVCYGEWGPVQ